MGGEWPIRKLAEICDSVDYGYTASAKDVPCGPKFLRITDIVSGWVDWSSVPYCKIDESTISKYRLYHGDVVIARTGATTGYSAYITEPPDAVFASYLVRLKAGQDADSRFISYFLKSPRFWRYMRGVLGDKSAQPNASATTMTQVTLPLPPIVEQQAIAHILGALDDKIELNRRMNQTLEGIAQALFRSWFVDFDPVRAKAAGEQPPGLAPHIADLFPDRFTDSPLGLIPARWRVGSILEIAELLSGGTPSTKIPEYWNGHIRWVSARDVSAAHGLFVLETERTITQEGVDNSSTKVLPELTTIVTARGTVGSYCILDEPMAMNQTNYGLKARRGDADYFVFLALGNLVSQLKQRAYGTIFDTVTTRTFETSQIVVPEDAVITEYDQHVQPLMEKVRQNLRQSGTLAALRDTLLPKLISGELRVPDAERIVGRFS